MTTLMFQGNFELFLQQQILTNKSKSNPARHVLSVMHNLGSPDVLFSKWLLSNILFIFSGTSLPLSPHSLCIFVLQANIYPILWNWSFLFIFYHFTPISFVFLIFVLLFPRPMFTPDRGSFLYFSNQIHRKTQGMVRNRKKMKILCHV